MGVKIVWMGWMWGYVGLRWVVEWGGFGVGYLGVGG